MDHHGAICGWELSEAMLVMPVDAVQMLTVVVEPLAVKEDRTQPGGGGGRAGRVLPRKCVLRS